MVTHSHCLFGLARFLGPLSFLLLSTVSQALVGLCIYDWFRISAGARMRRLIRLFPVRLRTGMLRRNFFGWMLRVWRSFEKCDPANRRRGGTKQRRSSQRAIDRTKVKCRAMPVYCI